MPCLHEKFHANVEVARLEDISGFHASIRIRCVECELEFSFLGLPSGISLERPMVSVDATELRVPIEPGPKPLAMISTIEMSRHQKES